eukprot:SAG31_NODE_126_length_23665_cov_6.178987_20_plen_77_part_00
MYTVYWAQRTVHSRCDGAMDRSVRRSAVQPRSSSGAEAVRSSIIDRAWYMLGAHVGQDTPSKKVDLITKMYAVVPR